MANTQLFTLGLGVTVSNPLGNAIDLLRRDVERLRRQAEGTRLGRLIGEVMRLGLELGSVRQVERELALDQEQKVEDQIPRLEDEAEAVERLRQHYLMLDRVIAGLARLKPLQTRVTINVVRASPAQAQEGAGAPVGKQPGAAPAAKADSPDLRVALAKGAVVAAGLGVTTLAGQHGAREVIRGQPRNTQRRIARVARKEWHEHRVGAIGKIGKALLENENAGDSAQGVGAAIGEVGGRVLGAVLPRFTKSRLARKHGAQAGAYLGEALGKWGGGKLYGWITEADNAQPDREVMPASAALESESALPNEQAQAPSPKQMNAVRGQGAVMASGLLAVAGYAALRKTQELPANTRRRIGRVTRREWLDNRVDALGNLGQAIVTSESGEERARGVGAAVGEMGGRLLGAALPRLTRSRLARKHGAKAGAYLGEAFGGMAGGGLFNWLTQARDPKSPCQVAPETGMEQRDALATPQATQPKPEIQALPSLLEKGASTRLPIVGKLLKRIPGAAQLDASLQIVETFNSDGTPAQKIEGYGGALGGLGGTLAGTAAGAAIGSVVPVIGTAIGGLIGGVLGGMGGESAGAWLGRMMAPERLPGAGKEAVKQPGLLMPAQESAAEPASQAIASGQPSQPVIQPTVNQQFTFTANMPVTFNNSLDDPTTLQQLEAIARRVLDDLMRQARSVQMADQPYP
ncbi:hypothetical protein ACIPZF_05150 [Pseudomonas sp. NPDC089752]|uniref:hypothetical protein n=1 Tax=Pseudomonas sp. NPDC089752 TaxID=3364472 RepID=UPI00380CAEA8